VDKFLEKYSNNLTGVISVFDRIIFKGYLPISYPAAAEAFLARRNVLLKDFSTFTKTHSAIIKNHIEQLAENASRPYIYLRNNVRKEDYVRDIADRDKITEGLVCILARNEENHSFGLRYGKGRPVLVKNSPRILTFYLYYVDRHFGLMHIRISTWLPFSIQIYINGHEWLARQMSRRQIEFRQCDNAFVHIANFKKAQALADRFPTLRWEKIMHAFANRVNPLLKTILAGMEYYWVMDQAEYATDVICRDRSWLDALYIKWQKHAAVCFQADDIMRFMGRKLHGAFTGTIVTDAKCRPAVTRVKHSVRGNWIKMYNKNGIVLRVETVINRPQEFRTFRIGHGRKAGYYEPLRKRVTNMFHYARLSLRANSAYLDALAPVDDPTGIYREITRICEPVVKTNRRARSLNPLRRLDRDLFAAVVRGEHHIHGFKSEEIGRLLGIEYAVPNSPERRRQGARVNRKLRLLRDHGLITRHGKSRRYRVTDMGMRHMNAALVMYEYHVPVSLKKAA
jgi:hypothetical protein